MKIPRTTSWCVVTLAVIASLGAATKLVAQQAEIKLGRSAHISTDAPKNPHAESFLAVNPKNAAQMIATSIVFGDPSYPRGSSRVYFSGDSGRTWRRSSSVGSGMPALMGTDPIVYFDSAGGALFGSITVGEFRVWR